MQLIVLSLNFISRAASAALFGLLLLIAFAITAPMGSHEYYGFYRYDYLLFYALIIQICLLYLKLESWDEAKVIALFHIMAMGMEIFLTHPAIASWQYPQPARGAGHPSSTGSLPGASGMRQETGFGFFRGGADGGGLACAGQQRPGYRVAAR